MARTPGRSSSDYEQALEKIRNDVMRLRPKALDTLGECLSAPSARIRKRAAKAILKHAPQLRLVPELQERIGLLEREARSVLDRSS